LFVKSRRKDSTVRIYRGDVIKISGTKRRKTVEVEQLRGDCPRKELIVMKFLC